jgi:hypothetical protein
MDMGYSQVFNIRAFKDWAQGGVEIEADRTGK